VEQEGGMEASEKYLRNFFEEKGTTYDDFIDKLIGNKGLFKVFFTMMKKLFS
jgi:hypothetical protein